MKSETPKTDEISVPSRTAEIIRTAFLPRNPNKMRGAAPEVVEAAKTFISLCDAAAMPNFSKFTLPNVAGRKIRGSHAEFERACLVHIERLQHGMGDYDGAMLDTLCEAVRLSRELCDMSASPNDNF